MTVTVSGGLAPFNFTAQVESYTQIGLSSFSEEFGNPPTASATAVSVVDGDLNVVPDGVSAVYDDLGGDSLIGGASDLKVYLQGSMSSGTYFEAGTGNSTVFAGGADTVLGSSGTLSFVGGAGAVSVVGGSGDATLFGGTSDSVLKGGTGNNTLVGGTGPNTIVGGNNAVIYGAGSGPTEIFAGTGLTVVHAQTGTGPLLLSTNPFGNSGQLVAQLNNSAATVVGGSGQSTIYGGGGKDIYSFINGHAGGSETIYGLKEGDLLVFGGYTGDAIKSETPINGSDHIVLTDGTQINLVGIDHKLF